MKSNISLAEVHGLQEHAGRLMLLQRLLFLGQVLVARGIRRVLVEVFPEFPKLFDLLTVQRRQLRQQSRALFLDFKLRLLQFIQFLVADADLPFHLKPERCFLSPFLLSVLLQVLYKHFELVPA